MDDPTFFAVSQGLLYFTKIKGVVSVKVEVDVEESAHADTVETALLTPLAASDVEEADALSVDVDKFCKRCRVEIGAEGEVFCQRCRSEMILED